MSARYQSLALKAALFGALAWVVGLSAHAWWPAATSTDGSSASSAVIRWEVCALVPALAIAVCPAAC